jgi:hypothetical protein
MGEDLIPEPTTTEVHFNNKNEEDTNLLFEPDENDMYIVHLSDVHYEDLNDIYINTSDITVIRIIKESYDEGTDFKEMMRSILGTQGDNRLFVLYKEP